MIKKLLILLLLLTITTFAEGDYCTILSGPRGGIVAIHSINTSDSVVLLQGVGYVEIKVTKEGNYNRVLTELPPEMEVDSVSLVVADGVLSCKMYSVKLLADNLSVAQKNGKALVLLFKESLPDFEFRFSEEDEVLADKVPVVDSISQFGRDGLLFFALHGRDLDAAVMEYEAGKIRIIAGLEYKLGKKGKTLQGGFSIKKSEDGCTVHFDTSKALYTLKNVNDANITMAFKDLTEYEVPQISFWVSPKKKKIIKLPELEVAEVAESVKKDEVKEVVAPVFEELLLVVVKEDINIRKQPKTSAPKIASLKMGTSLTAIDENKKWYSVRLESGEIGWVYKKLVKREQDLTQAEADKIFALNMPKEPEPEKVIDQAKVVKELTPENADDPVVETTVFLIKDNVNIRTTPKTGSRKTIIGAFPKGTRLVSLGEKNNWHKVRMDDGQLAWVYATFIQDSASITPEMWDSFYNSGKADEGMTVEIESKDSLSSGDETFDIAAKPNVFKVQAEDSSKKSSKVKGKKKPKEKTELQKEEPQKIVISYKKYGRDPFLPLNVKNLAKPSMPKIDDLALIGVIYSDAPGAQNFALFEEKVKGKSTTFSLKEGEPIEDGKLLHIEENRVVFLMREADFTYTVEKIMEKIDE